MLVFMMPDMMSQTHKEYHLGGSEIGETNTCNGTALAQGEYKM